MVLPETKPKQSPTGGRTMITSADMDHVSGGLRTPANVAHVVLLHQACWVEKAKRFAGESECEVSERRSRPPTNS